MTEGALREAGSYRPEIDGLRALAVFAVMLNHFASTLLPSGFLGVDVFFVISGCVITASLAAKDRGHLKSYLVGFYSRRIKRLLPALLACVVITGILICFFDPNPRLSIRTGIASLFGVSNLYLFRQRTDYFAPSTDLNVFTHTWSLGVEEQFYVVFPLLFWWSGRWAHARGMLRAGVSLIAIVSVALFLREYTTNVPAAYFLMPARFWELGVGCLLATAPTSVSASGTRLPGAAGATMLVVLLATFFAPTHFAPAATIVAVLATAVIIGTARPGTLVISLLGKPPIVAVGRLSYSLYLWHWSVLALARWTVGVNWMMAPLEIVLIGCLATASYEWVERPLRHASWSRSRSVTIAIGLSASLLCAAALAFLGTQELYSGHARTLIQPIDYVGKFTSRVARRCHSSDSPPNDALKGETHITPQFERDCLFDPDVSHPLVAFVGDSHTLSLFPLSERLAASEGVSVFAHSRDGCAFPSQGPTTRRGCDEVMRNTIIYLLHKLANRPGGIVVATSYLGSHFGYDGDHRRQFLRHPTGSREDVDANLHDYVSAVAATARALSRVKATLVVVAPFPRHPGFDPVRCPQEWFRPAFSISANCLFTDRGSLVVKRHEIMRSLGELTAIPNVIVYDAFDRLCQSAVRCLTMHNGAPLFADDNHLSEAGALLLYDDFVQLLRSHGLIGAGGPGGARWGPASGRRFDGEDHLSWASASAGDQPR